MSRVTEKQLEGLVNQINKLTDNNPEPYIKASTLPITWNVGTYLLTSQYGRVGFDQVMETDGAVRSVFGFFMPKRELHDCLKAFIIGFSNGKETVVKH